MLLSWTHVSIGLIVGILVGLTGVGGGVILLPILIFGLKVPALIAVGSDAAFNALTKLGAGIFHWRAGTVHWKLVGVLCFGSLPGALAGVLLLDHLRATLGPSLNHFLILFIGALLVFIPFLLLLEGRTRQFLAVEKQPPRRMVLKLIAIGLFAGFLVGLSSVGSGSVVMVLLLLLVHCPPAVLVGTDIVHAIALTGFTGILQFRFGNVDLALVMSLLVGSIPGALIGVKIGQHLPSLWLKRTLCVILLITGARMLGV